MDKKKASEWLKIFDQKNERKEEIERLLGSDIEKQRSKLLIRSEIGGKAERESLLEFDRNIDALKAELATLEEIMPEIRKNAAVTRSFEHIPALASLREDIERVMSGHLERAKAVDQAAEYYINTLRIYLDGFNADNASLQRSKDFEKFGVPNPIKKNQFSGAMSYTLLALEHYARNKSFGLLPVGMSMGKELQPLEALLAASPEFTALRQSQDAITARIVRAEEGMKTIEGENE